MNEFCCGESVLKKEETRVFRFENVRYGEFIIINALCEVSSKAYVGVRFFRNGFQVNYPSEGDGDCLFYGSGIRDYLYRFIVPFGVDEAELFIKAGLSDIHFRMIEIYKKREFPQIQPIGNGVKCVAHLGMVGYAPRNTMSAFQLAKRAGYRECVVNTNGTKDGYVVALHNDTIDATSNGTGSVYDMILAELREYDFGGYYNEIYKNERIPLMSEVLSFMSHSGLRPVLRLSSNFFGEKLHYLERLYDIVKKNGLAGHCTAKGFGKEVLAELSHMAGNDFRYGYCCDNFTQEDCDFLKTLGKDVYLDLYYKSYTKELRDLALNNGIPLEVWIINDFSEIVRLASEGVTGFTTDFYNLDGCIF